MIKLGRVQSLIQKPVGNMALESAAIESIKKVLEGKFETIERNGAKSDLKAVNENGEVFYYEIKSTRKNPYFGSASFSEWKLALENPESYFFIVAYFNDGCFDFFQFSPKEFLSYSTIPPIKVYFNLDIDNPQKKKKPRTALPLSVKAFKRLGKAFEDERKASKEKK